MRRFTISIQTVEIDENGQVIDGFDDRGPSIATTSWEHAKLAAARLEELSAEVLRGYAEPSTISNQYPEDK